MCKYKLEIIVNIIFIAILLVINKLPIFKTKCFYLSHCYILCILYFKYFRGYFLIFKYKNDNFKYYYLSLLEKFCTIHQVLRN